MRKLFIIDNLLLRDPDFKRSESFNTYNDSFKTIVTESNWSTAAYKRSLTWRERGLYVDNINTPLTWMWEPSQTALALKQTERSVLPFYHCRVRKMCWYPLFFDLNAAWEGKKLLEFAPFASLGLKKFLDYSPNRVSKRALDSMVFMEVLDNTQLEFLLMYEQMPESL